MVIVSMIVGEIVGRGGRPAPSFHHNTLRNGQSRGAKRLAMMTYQPIVLSCECGKIPRLVSAVGLSATRHLVIRWHCPQCKKEVYVFKPLDDCLRECPAEDE